ILAFTIQRAGKYGIATLTRTAAGWKTEELLQAEGRAFVGPEFSPDGKWLAYGGGNARTSQDISVEPVPRAAQVIRVTRDGGYWPFWSKNADGLFFRSISNAVNNRLRYVGVETAHGFRFSSESLVASTGFSVQTNARDYDITADGKRLLM